MSKYSALDAHSRNCASCIRQRELDIPVDHGGHSQEKKKTSLPSELRKISGARTSLVRRSNSSLSYSDVGGVKKEDTFEGSTYLTPTQRKNQEMKRMRLELAKANELLQTKDKEITLLRREVSALKESGQMNDSWTAESGSITDSGNCEEICSTWDADQEVDGSTPGSGNKLENIDFELMETALKEEEETRHKLEAGNEDLRDQLMDARRELAFMKDQCEEEIGEMKKTHEDEIFELKKVNSHKIEELVNELAESSLRCARQQDAIEQKQNRLDNILRELAIYKDNLTKAEEKLLTQEGNLAKVNTDIETKPEYLSLVTNNAGSIAVQHSYSQTEPKDQKNTDCQTEFTVELAIPPDQRNDNLPEVEVDLGYPKSKEESTCDNKIHYTYQFLKRSIFYFITDKENSAYHLKSIERLLEFSDTERSVINKSKPIVKKY
eukprot:GFUD01006040.1.p1 GENE.GFUD01006040.1~~GFUD01006040.1.p1  ORF type:complete len:437 (+),score=93.08 GFUD01006040.1:239-1549(+)